ncbi:MAG: hypothetical protein P4L99_05870 [Chthoniobacter sp.]|nr:hypothetical protein [Chthoniobacter sp.]
MRTTYFISEKFLLISVAISFLACSLVLGAEKEETEYKSPNGKATLTVATNPRLPSASGQRRTFSLIVGHQRKWAKTFAGEWVGPPEVIWLPDSSLVAIADSANSAGDNVIYAINNVFRSPTVYHHKVDALAESLVKSLKGDEKSLETYKFWISRLTATERNISAILWISCGTIYKCPISFAIGRSRLHLTDKPIVSTFSEAIAQ